MPLKEAESNSPISALSARVAALAALLGGGRGREYKSCIFGTKGTPKPGHIARCNRKFFGGPRVKIKKGKGGSTRAHVTAGPGQAAKKSGKQAARRKTEGR